MKFENLLQGRFLKRYKRFLVDVDLGDGRVITVHCLNTGSMKGCLNPGNAVLLSQSDNPKRKYPHTLEMIRVGEYWVGINTNRTNHLVREALENGVIDDFGPLDHIQAEVKVSDKSRLDFLLCSKETKIYVEVKNCTLVEGEIAMFPDAVTVRGTKHLLELAELKKKGFEAAIFYCVQRMDGKIFSPAVHIDPTYSKTLREVAAKGVKIVAYQASVGPDEICISRKLPIRL